MKELQKELEFKILQKNPIFWRKMTMWRLEPLIVAEM